MVNREEIITLTIEKYQDRLKKVLQNVKTELERFSWHCSKIFRLGDGAYAIEVSRDPKLIGQDDPFNIEVSVSTYIYTHDDEKEKFGMSFEVRARSFEGVLIRSNKIFADDFKFMKEGEIEKDMEMLEAFDPHQIVVALYKEEKGRFVK